MRTLLRVVGRALGRLNADLAGWFGHGPYPHGGGYATVRKPKA